MKPELPPETIKVYALIRRTEMLFSYCGQSSTQNVGFGFFINREEAELQRTIEVLRKKDTEPSEFYIFELEVPNPIR